MAPPSTSQFRDNEVRGAVTTHRTLPQQLQSAASVCAAHSVHPCCHQCSGDLEPSITWSSWFPLQTFPGPQAGREAGHGIPCLGRLGDQETPENSTNYHRQKQLGSGKHHTKSSGKVSINKGKENKGFFPFSVLWLSALCLIQFILILHITSAVSDIFVCWCHAFHSLDEISL